MNTKTKALILALCAVLLVVTTVFVTMAFLTSEDSVQNTFTFGHVSITLDEADVDKDGNVEAGADRTSTEGRVDANEYHLMPGHSYTKDPTIHVGDSSEDCWLFVKLKNGLKTITVSDTIEEQMEDHGWTVIDEPNNIWAYGEKVSAGADIPVFDSFTINDEADVSAYATVKDANGNVTGGATVDIVAYAVQYDGFEAGATAAWDATFGN